MCAIGFYCECVFAFARRESDLNGTVVDIYELK